MSGDVTDKILDHPVFPFTDQQKSAVRRLLKEQERAEELLEMLGIHEAIDTGSEQRAEAASDSPS